MEIEIPFYNDVWLDNGIENFYYLINEFEDEIPFDMTIYSDKLSFVIKDENFEKLFSFIINDNRDTLIVKSVSKIGEKKEIKKDFVLIQEGKKIDGIVAFKENVYSEPEKSLQNLKELILADGKKKCVLCGRTFSKPYKKLQQAAYPFVTKIKSLSGIRTYKDGQNYSFKEYYDNVCPICYLIGILQWLDDRMVYRTFPGDKTFLFLPCFDNLKDLVEFKKDYSPLLNKMERYSNIKVKIDGNKTENTPGKYSTLLCFYGKFFMDINDEDNEIVCKKWAVLEVPFGSVKNVKLKSVNLDSSTLGIIQEFIQNNMDGVYEVINGFNFFIDNPKGAPVDWDITRKIREKSSEAFLSNDFRTFSKNLLPRKGGKVGYSSQTRKYLEDLIYIWRLKKMGIPKEGLKSIKGVGNIVAKVSKNNISILYKLDKVRTLNEFWSVLREVSRKLVGLNLKTAKVRPTALDELIQLIKDHEDEWMEIRDLLVVYSSMYYSIGTRGGDKDENE
jgi:hypothetical protein